MKSDYQNYSRATSISLLGLAIQAVMGFALLVYSVVTKDHAGLTGALFVLTGGFVWLCLAVVFDQHRRERIESLENESLAQSGGRESSVFSGDNDELRVAGKRLAWMHRIFMPVASLVLAGALAGIGFWRFFSAQKLLASGATLNPDREVGWPIFLGIGMAFIGFLFARFVSGMAKQSIWGNLRAGAAQSVGAALVGLAVGGVYLIAKAGTGVAWQYLPLIMPVAMIVLSAEVVLNFLLGVYRPRRAGETPRAAMDSRILGFVAAPDRIAQSIGEAINYQFGFDVTSSWFYQLLSRSLTVLILVGVGVIWAMTCLTVIEPNEQGLRVRFGRQVGEAMGPGAYLKMPWPFERVERMDALTQRRINLGGDKPTKKGPILWTNDHGVTERYFIVQPSAAERSISLGEGEAADRGGEATKDIVLVSAEVPLFYTIEDLAKYQNLGAAEEREEILRAIGRRELHQYLAVQTLDSVLGYGRAAAGEELRARIQKRFDEAVPGGIGVRVQFVGIESVHPPRDTAEGFESVVQGVQRRLGNIEQASSDADRELIRAVGSVEKAGKIVAALDEFQRTADALPAIATDEQRAALLKKEQEVEALIVASGGLAAEAITKARAQRWVRHMAARARADGYAGQLLAYRASPSAFIAGRYFSTLRDSMADSRVYIVVDDGELELRINLEESALGGNLFDRPKKDEE